ncbi:hypothetical protein AMTRI_Chr02g257390 [Amborella trichopoda]
MLVFMVTHSILCKIIVPFTTVVEKEEDNVSCELLVNKPCPSYY